MRIGGRVFFTYLIYVQPAAHCKLAWPASFAGFFRSIAQS